MTAKPSETVRAERIRDACHEHFGGQSPMRWAERALYGGRASSSLSVEEWRAAVRHAVQRLQQLGLWTERSKGLLESSRARYGAKCRARFGVNGRQG